LVDGQKKVALGGEYSDFSDGFRMFLSTKYPNPVYSPEVCSQVMLINFTTTLQGLEDLLMNNLIEVEQLELERMRVALMEANAENTKLLQDVETAILAIVSNPSSDILNDNTAIETLQKAQKTSADIETQMIASQKTEKTVASFREKFGSVSEYAALLYFCAADFAVVDPMYQFSLKWFVSMFKAAVQNAPHPSEMDELITSFHDAIATKFFQSVSFSLFAKHKLLFSTLMATRILTSRQMISKSELAFLLQPQAVPSAEERIAFIPEDVWRLFPGLISSSPAFVGLVESIK
jgi:hypothetical protein